MANGQERDTHRHGEKERETQKWIQWSNGKYNGKERHKKRETDRGLTQSGELPTLLGTGRATSCSHIVGRIRGNCLLYLFHGGGFIGDGRTSAWSAWASLFGVEKRLSRAVRGRWIRFPHRFA